MVSSLMTIMQESSQSQSNRLLDRLAEPSGDVAELGLELGEVGAGLLHHRLRCAIGEAGIGQLRTQLLLGGFIARGTKKFLNA